MQPSNAKLREQALQEIISYDSLMSSGVAKEQSVRGAAAMEKASGQSGSNPKVKIEEEVRKLRQENKQLRSQSKKCCNRCGKTSCVGGTKCPANSRKCGKCQKPNHFAKV